VPREVVLGIKLAPTTPDITIQQTCGTSLQAAPRSRSGRHRGAPGAERRRGEQSFWEDRDHVGARLDLIRAQQQLRYLAWP
jgi:hypothetical protein